MKKDHQTLLNFAILAGKIAKKRTFLPAYLCRVTELALCDPIWQVMLRSFAMDFL